MSESHRSSLSFSDLLPLRQSLLFPSLWCFTLFFHESVQLLFGMQPLVEIPANVLFFNFALISIAEILLKRLWWSNNKNKPTDWSVNLSIRMGLIQLGNQIQIWFWATALCLRRAGILSPGCAIVFRRSGLLSLDQVFCARRLTQTSNREQNPVLLPAQRYDRKRCIKTLRGVKFKVCSFVNILTGNCI